MPIWAHAMSDHILPVVSGAPPLEALRSVIDLDHLSCRVCVVTERSQLAHIVFAQEGRQLQLALSTQFGAGPGMLTPAVLARDLAGRRALALKRFADLISHGQLRHHLYPAETRAPRYARILQALDGARQGVRYREIAVGLFGEERVRADWALPDNHLRDHVRRAIAQGRALLEGGFVRLLA